MLLFQLQRRWVVVIFGHRVVGHVEMTTVFEVVGRQHVEASRQNCGPGMGHLQGSFESVG